MSTIETRLFLWILLAIVGSLSESTVLPLQSSIFQNGSDVTALAAVPGIDPRFQISSEYGAPRLPGMACLMNAVNAMRDLALEDFNEPLVPIVYILDSFPEVMIAPEAVYLGGAIQTRFIVWGLWAGINAMLERSVFQTAVITLKYDFVTVGYVKIAQPGAQLKLGTNSTDSQRSTDKRSTVGISVNNTQASSENQLSVSFNPIEPPLSGHDVLIAVLYGLMFAARFPATIKVDRFGLFLRSPYNMRIEGYPITAASPTSEPFLEYRWIIISLAQIPEYMLQRRRFSGVSFKTRIGRVTVGEGQIIKKVT